MIDLMAAGEVRHRARAARRRREIRMDVMTFSLGMLAGVSLAAVVTFTLGMLAGVALAGLVWLGPALWALR